MADKVWTAAELEAMSPAEQDDLFNSSVVTDLDDVRPSSSRECGPGSPTVSLGSNRRTSVEFDAPNGPGDPWFFEDLDRQLPAERGPEGQPSTNDFQVFELLRIVERFAVGFEDLPRLIRAATTIGS